MSVEESMNLASSSFPPHHFFLLQWHLQFKFSKPRLPGLKMQNNGNDKVPGHSSNLLSATHLSPKNPAYLQTLSKKFLCYREGSLANG